MLAGVLPYPRCQASTTFPTSRTASMMHLDDVPTHLAIVGGSYVGLEFAQMFRRFGSDVTVIEMAPRLVQREDDDVSTAIRDILVREGIAVRGECALRQRLSWKRWRGGARSSARKDKSDNRRLRISCWRWAGGRTPTTSDSTRPVSPATTTATSSSTIDCRPVSPASGRWETATARARSLTRRERLRDRGLKSPRRSDAARLDRVRHMRSTSTLHSAAPASPRRKHDKRGHAVLVGNASDGTCRTCVREGRNQRAG